jgi:chaperonin GroEL (HSP60 family)
LTELQLEWGGIEGTPRVCEVTSGGYDFHIIQQGSDVSLVITRDAVSIHEELEYKTRYEAFGSKTL